MIETHVFIEAGNDRDERLYALAGPDDVAAFVLGLDTEEHPCVVFSAADLAFDLCLSISSGRVFVAAATPEWFDQDELYEWVAAPSATGSIDLMIGGVPTEVDLSTVLDVPAAAELARLWARGDLDPPGHAWRRL